MKLLVFAHVPPPHHGQSYMVKLMLDGFGGDCRGQKQKSPNAFGIECYHVNARFSRTLEDIGEFQGGKIFLILFFCLQAIWCRFRHGVENFYYVPAPGKAVALYRDWLIMLICRPFFKKIILHWHAAGLAKWLETSAQIRSRAITYRLFKPVNLSIVLSNCNIADAEKLLSRRVRVVNNGIPDPCPDFAENLLPLRRSRLVAREKILAGEKSGFGELKITGENPRVINVLFLAHCTREKGLFDTMAGAVAANRTLAAQNSPLRVKLSIAGHFVTDAEKSEFEHLMAAPEFADAIDYRGFLAEDKKNRALREADLFCFPTYHYAESFGLVVVEAMAFGLPVITTRWRAIPEILPEHYDGFVEPKSPGQIAGTLLRLAANNDLSQSLRETFLQRFTLENHLAKLAHAMQSLESIESSAAPTPVLQNP